MIQSGHMPVWKNFCGKISQINQKINKPYKALLSYKMQRSEIITLCPAPHPPCQLPRAPRCYTAIGNSSWEKLDKITACSLSFLSFYLKILEHTVYNYHIIPVWLQNCMVYKNCPCGQYWDMLLDQPNCQQSSSFLAF